MVLRALLAGLIAVPALAVAPQRILQIDNARRTTLRDSRPPRAAAAVDLGGVAGMLPMRGMTLVFKLTAAQQADLDSLMLAQQDPHSALYHQWLTPAQFGARFGLSDGDLARAETWLQQQGFTIDSVSSSRTRITFSGTARQAEAAFGTQLHYYRTVTGDQRYAPATDISLPAALGTAVAAVTHLSSFRLDPHVIRKDPQAAVTTASPDFTSGETGNHYLTPGDIAIIYDVKPAYSAGYDGSGQTIVIIGQSAIVPSDITKFQSAAGIAVHSPTLILVPGSGTSTVFPGDEGESDLDLEWSSSMAPGATVKFVYTGNSPNYGVFDALQYAVDNELGSILSLSYGECEPLLGASDYAALDPVLSQAAVQGQTFITSSGDSGSTSCYDQTKTQSIKQQVAASYPASSAYATAMGGTEFSSAAVSSSNTTYWIAANGSDVLTSAQSYIPEQVWNDDSTGRLLSGGGGVSIFAARPSWQTGFAGITGSYRLVPDISMDASPSNAGLLFCSTDSTFGGSGSCANGFRNSSGNGVTAAGGTSFDAPIFAGLMALINQSQGSTGEGLINPVLYALAANSSTYATVFHDITTGSNACTAGSSTCGTGSATTLYQATTGYDEATGLGSIDFYNLLNAWPTGAAAASPGYTVTTSPAGLAFSVDSVSYTSPQSFSWPWGTQHTVAVSSPVAVSEGTATFANWSDAGAISHTVTAGATTTYTANFTEVLTPAMVFTAPAKKHDFDVPFTVSASSDSGGAFTYKRVSGPATVSAAGLVTLTGAGTVVVEADQAASGWYVATSATGNIVVTRGSVWAVNTDGSASELDLTGAAFSSNSGYAGAGVVSPVGPLGIAFDGNGDAWIASSAGISEFDGDGNAISGSPFTGGGVVTSPGALAIDGSGQVIVADGNGSVEILSSAGALVSTTTDASVSGPTGVAIDAAGSVWIANGTANTVDEVIGGAAPTTPLVSGTPGVKP
ncbi:MAG: protease pro-enzyme activation domain-containing protein [Acidobacteriota bacterium]